MRELLYRIEWSKRGQLRVGILCVGCYIMGLSRLIVYGTRLVRVTNLILNIESFEEQCVIIKYLFQSELLKTYNHHWS